MAEWLSLPVYQWQYRRLARGGRLHISRLLIAFLLLGLISWMLRLSPLTNPSTFHTLIHAAGCVLLVWSAFVVPLQAIATCNSFFRGGLGILALGTPMTPISIVLTLLISVLIEFLVVLLLPLPVVVLVAYYTNVDATRLLMFAIALLLLALQGASFALIFWVSCLDRPRAAYVGFIAFWIALLFVSCLFPFVTPFPTVSDFLLNGILPSMEGWLLYSLVLPGPMLTVYLLFRYVRRKSKSITIYASNDRTAEIQRAHDKTWYMYLGEYIDDATHAGGPLGFIALIFMQLGSIAVMFVIVGGGILFAFGILSAVAYRVNVFWMLSLGWFAFWILTIWMAANHPRLVKRDDTWELLLTTPIAARDYISGARKTTWQPFKTVLLLTAYFHGFGLIVWTGEAIYLYTFGASIAFAFWELVNLLALTGERRVTAITSALTALCVICFLPIALQVVNDGSMNGWFTLVLTAGSAAMGLWLVIARFILSRRHSLVATITVGIVGFGSLFSLLPYWFDMGLGIGLDGTPLILLSPLVTMLNSFDWRSGFFSAFAFMHVHIFIAFATAILLRLWQIVDFDWLTGRTLRYPDLKRLPA